MDNKQRQINFKKQEYYKNLYKKKKAVREIRENIREGDVYAKIIDNVVHRHNDFLNRNNVIINLSPMELIGCNKQKFTKHINDKLNGNMTINNYGEWEIDHIFPLSKIDFTNTEEILKYFNYKNLQPLSHIENFIKSNKI